LNFSGRTLSDLSRPALVHFQLWAAEKRVRIMGRMLLLVTASLLALNAFAQNADRMQDGPTTVIGPRNPDLQDGAKQLLAGRAKEGVELTLRGLKVAQGAREEEAALSNLCAGYIMLENYAEALKYCELLIERNDQSWRAYNNRAVIYINTAEYEKAHRDLVKGEELNPGARTLRIARAMYLDAVDPVAPEVEIDDRQGEADGDDENP
jgi:tetratricopeptide (TPR) repeat protein